jgi:hypothetical protein
VERARGLDKVYPLVSHMKSTDYISTCISVPHNRASEGVHGVFLRISQVQRAGGCDTVYPRSDISYQFNCTLFQRVLAFRSVERASCIQSVYLPYVSLSCVENSTCICVPGVPLR